MLDKFSKLAIVSNVNRPLTPSPMFRPVLAREPEENPARDWTRTRLQPREREDLLVALTSEQKAQLLKHDYVWVEGAGVLWKPPDGALRRARFTHGAQFRTQRGEFYIDSEGSARELSITRA